MNKIENLFDTYKISTYASTKDKFMIPYLIKELGYGVFLYGGGAMAMVSLKYMKDVMDIEPDFIVDAHPKCTHINSIKVISLKEFKGISKEKKYCAIVSNSYFSRNEDEKIEIIKRLSLCGVDKVIDIYNDISLIIKNDWYSFIIENKSRFIENYNLFADDISKDTYYHFLEAILEGHEYRGREFSEKDKYFATETDSKLYKHIENETWINMGSFRGDTIYHFVCNHFEFEKIYAVECDKSVLGTLERNLNFLADDIRKKIDIVPFYFGDNAGKKIDNYFEDTRISLINMDIEGAEEEVLNSARKTIYNCRPVLAVCVYHKPDDLIRIPDLISSIVDDYVFYLRKYPSLRGAYYDGIYRVNEFVLYAVPRERKI